MASFTQMETNPTSTLTDSATISVQNLAELQGHPERATTTEMTADTEHKPEEDTADQKPPGDIDPSSGPSDSSFWQKQLLKSTPITVNNKASQEESWQHIAVSDQVDVPYHLNNQMLLLTTSAQHDETLTHTIISSPQSPTIECSKPSNTEVPSSAQHPSILPLSSGIAYAEAPTDCQSRHFHQELATGIHPMGSQDFLSPGHTTPRLFILPSYSQPSDAAVMTQ